MVIAMAAAGVAKGVFDGIMSHKEKKADRELVEELSEQGKSGAEIAAILTAMNPPKETKSSDGGGLLNLLGGLGGDDKKGGGLGGILSMFGDGGGEKAGGIGKALSFVS